jgi:hypothetical protein
MTKKFSAAMITGNVVVALFLYLSTQAMLLHLNATNPYLTVTGVNIDKIFIGAVQPSTSPTSLVVTAFPNLPFLILLVPLLLNAFLIVKVWRSSGLAKRFPLALIISNVIIGLFLFLSSQATLLQLVGTMNSYVRISAVSFLSFFEGAVQVGSSPVPLVIVSEPNLSSYVFMVSLIVNVCFTIKLLLRRGRGARLSAP